MEQSIKARARQFARVGKSRPRPQFINSDFLKNAVWRVFGKRKKL